MAKVKKKSLLDLIDQIDWKKLEISRSYHKALAANVISVGFYPHVKSGEEINQVRVRFGAEVLEKLKWNYGDKVCLYFDDSAEKPFLIVKSENGEGNTITKEKNSHHSRVYFKWLGDFKLPKMIQRKVTFEISKKQLIFTTLKEYSEE